jgi:large repetitive protein
MNFTKVLLSIACLSLIVLGFSTCEEPEKPKPEIISVFPTEAAVGESVVITGKNLSGATDVVFGSISAGIATKSDIEILTVVPASILPGSTTVSVKAEERVSNEVTFTVLESIPEITSIAPAKGSSGMEIVLKGKYFRTISLVTFGDTDITTFALKTDTTAKVTIPSLDLGVVDVTVTTDGGTSEKFTFTIVGKPEITSLLPIIGPIGKVVTIKGKFFEEASKVFFGEGQAEFQIKDAATIEATVPATATTGKVKVVTPGGEAISTATYTIKDAPQITSFTPASGIVGAVITVNGNNFDAGSLAVKFGSGAATTVTMVNAQKLTAKVPATGTTGKITVTTIAGSATSNDNFTVIGAPVITSVSPETGLIGADVVINGKDFTGVTELKFNETIVPVANYTVVSSQKITTKVPAGASSGKISVKAVGGTGQSPNSFTVQVPPVITSFTPDKIVRDGEVVVTGTGFSNITSVKVGGVELGAANYTVNSSTKITLKAIKAAVTGKIAVANATGSSTSANTLNIYPYIDKVDPITGTSGTVLTIDGTNLLGSKVKFNTTEVTPTSITALQIKVTVPVGLNGAINITVANGVGASNSKPFTASVPVVLNEVVSVFNVKGELILLSGSNLAGATKVWFGTTAATVLTSTAKVVTVKIPGTLALGPYDVKVETPKGISNAKPFEVINIQPPATGGVTLATGVSVTSLPAGYVPPISNQWYNELTGSEQMLIQQGSNNTLTVEFRRNFTPVADGTGIYNLSSENGVIDNYIEFTVNGVRYVGMWQPPSDYNDTIKKYCYNHMTLISTESGKILQLTVYNFECDN